MRILIAENYEALSAQAAKRIAEQVKRNPSSVLGLATGSTPIGTYGELVRMYREGRLDFSRVRTFNLDEYYGLNQQHEQSYYHFMHQQLFGKVNLPKGAAHVPSGVPNNVEDYCKAYEEEIWKAGGIDLQLLGLGRNGHIGFNEPGTGFEEETRLVDLTQDTIDANSRFFDNAEDVPKQAISMGIKTIMKAKSILLLASGEAKAETVRDMINGRVTKSLPASILQLHPDVTILLDKAAASKLEGKCSA